MAVNLNADQALDRHQLLPDEIEYGVLYDMYVVGAYVTKVIRIYHEDDRGYGKVKVASILPRRQNRPGEATWKDMDNDFRFLPSTDSVTIDGKPCGGGGLQ